MPIQRYGAFLLIAWLLVICAVTIAAGATSIPALTILALFAVLPPFFVSRLLNDAPSPTMSQTIQQARQ